MTTVAVAGAGSWGTTAAVMLSGRSSVGLWVRRSSLAATIASTRRNPTYTGDLDIPIAIAVHDDGQVAFAGAELVILAVPSHGLRLTLRELSPSIGADAIVVSLVKGLEQGSHLRMSQVINQEVPGRRVVVLTGPNLVQEIIAGLPAASVSVSADADAAVVVQRLFASDSMRVYTNGDVIGAEIAGSLKNVVAIAVGMGDGLGVGDNAKAALITRGLAELTRLGVALGASAGTFSGLAGIGDLVATCSSRLSRNRAFGRRLAMGLTPAEVQAETAMVAEGVRTSSAAVALASTVGVEMPIASVVADVIAGRLSATEATDRLMKRAVGDERHGFAG